MPQRNRIIYQSQAVFVSTGNATGAFFSSGNSGVNFIKQLSRIQTVSTNVQITREDVLQQGNLARIDQIILTAPVATLDMTYLLTDGSNEQYIGLQAKGGSSIVSGILNKVTDQRNFFVLIAAEGVDANGDADFPNHRTECVSQGFLSNYQVQAQVGQLPTATVSIEGLNYVVDVGSTGLATPAVDPQNGLPITGFSFSLPVGDSYTGINAVTTFAIPSALRPGDITVQIPANAALGPIMSGVGSANIQSFNLSVPLSRQPLQRLGTTFAYSREIQFPVTATVTINAFVGDLQAANLSDVLCNDQEFDLALLMRNPSCSGNGTNAMRFDIKVKLSTQARSLNIGEIASQVNLTYTTQIGSANDNSHGVFLSGSFF